MRAVSSVVKFNYLPFIGACVGVDRCLVFPDARSADSGPGTTAGVGNGQQATAAIAVAGPAAGDNSEVNHLV